jgi:hypothetical protein
LPVTAVAPAGTTPPVTANVSATCEASGPESPPAIGATTPKCPD